MSIVSVVLIAFALAMDAFAVSVANGVMLKKNNFYYAYLASFSFGFFQLFMPLLGWIAGTNFRSAVENYTSMIAFALLFIIGYKMVYESFKLKGIESKPLSVMLILVLSVATSIDAFAMGITFSMLKMAIVVPVLIIGIITFVISLFGFFIGNRVGKIFESKAELLGGVILILLGLKILLL